MTTSVRVAIGIRKLDGGCSWLFELTPVLIVGLNTPAAAATRVSLICGSSRSAREIDVVVERHLHGLVDGEPQRGRRLRGCLRRRRRAEPERDNAMQRRCGHRRTDDAAASELRVGRVERPRSSAPPSPKIRTFDASSNSE